MSQAEKVLWIINLGLVLALVGRLILTKLYRRYICFFALLCLQGGQTLALLPFPANTNAYAWVYFLTQPLIWLLYVLVVLELYSLALREHRGIASMSRWVLIFGMVVALVIAALSLSADLSGPSGQYPVLVTIGIIERGISFSLVLFLLLITGFLLWMPVQIPRNVVLHVALFTTYFLINAGALFVRNLFGYHLVGVVSATLLSINNLCLLLWVLLLNRQGEETPVVVRRLWRRSDEDLITRQLDAVNAFLLRSAGKQDR